MSLEIGARVGPVNIGATALGPSQKQQQNESATSALFDRAAEDLAQGDQPAHAQSSLDALLARPSPLDRFRDDAKAE